MKKYKKIYIEITNVCNLLCEFCPKTKRHPEFMRRELFEEILWKIKGHAQYLYFHVMGEPLLHPEIGLFLELCHKYGYVVNITTNGTLIEEALEHIISKPALRQVNFSLHSFEANTNQYSMDSYLDRIFKFIKVAQKERQLLTCLRLWNLSEDMKTKKNMDVLERIEREFCLDFKIEETLTKCRGIKIGANVFLSQAAEFEWPDIMKNEIPGKAFCYGLRDQIGILSDGTVIPCCLDREGIMNLGNIKEQEFAEIIEGKRAKAIYEGFSRREAVEELCKKCGYRTRFNK